jgi:hypothetical protein
LSESQTQPSEASLHVLAKWRLIAWFWSAQAIFVVFFAPVWIMQGESVKGPDHPLGVWDLDRTLELLGDPLYWLSLILIIAGLMTLQIALVWPVRKPRVTRSGRPLLRSLAAAALVGTGLATAIVLGLVTIFELNRDFHVGVNERIAVWLFWSWCAVSYFGGGALMYGFCRRSLRRGGTHESALGRLSAILFTGTLVEAAAIMPIDVMFRKREDCYCLAGTFWAYTVLLAAGLVTIGPAILLPMLMHRRKRWYASRCACCGYDMSGLLESGREFDRCPECGAGWRT